MSQFNPTTKTQAALSAAVQSASAAGNPDVRPGHLLVALLEQQDGIATPLLQACGVDPQLALTQAKALTASYPSASGSGLAAPNFNRDALAVISFSQTLASEMGDDYVSTEHLLLALSEAVQGLPQHDDILKAIETVIANGDTTRDMGGSRSTQDVGKAIAELLGA